MHIYEQNNLQMTSLFIIFEAGSMVESKGKFGTMHLMEHMICKNYDDMRDTLQENGIVSNAYTSDSQVVFWFKGLESKLSPLKAELVNRIVGGFRATDEQLQMEKKVVVEEYLDTFNDQSIGNYYNTMRKFYGYHGAIGLRNDIEAFTYDDAIRVYNDYFTKPVRIVEVGPSKSDLSFVTYADDAVFTFNAFNVYDHVIEPVNAENKLSVVGIGRIKCDSAEYPTLKLGLSVLGDGLNSPLYKAIREDKGLSYFSWCDAMEFNYFGIPLFGSCTEKDRIDELMNVYTDFIKNIDSHITEERFNICKNRALVVLEKRDVVRYDCPEDLINGNGIFQYRGLHDITFAQVKSVIKKYINTTSIEFVVC